jgi:hypothetical protein
VIVAGRTQSRFSLILLRGLEDFPVVSASLAVGNLGGSKGDRAGCI